jgi:hypothetical protein
MSIRVPTCLLLVFALGGLALSASDAGAQAYTYEDDKGRRHYTDNPAAIPAEYRDQLEERAMDPMPRRASPGAQAGEESAVVERFLGEFFKQMNQDRRRRSLPPLSLQQRQQVEGWAHTWLGPLIVGSVLSLVLGIGLVIHGFATGHYGWALANLFLYVTQPFYVMLHVGEDKMAVRVIVLLAVLVPMGISTLATKSLVSVAQALLT